MRVLVWKSHGDISVYCAENHKQLENIARTVYSIVSDWNIIDKEENFEEDLKISLRSGKPRSFIERFVDKYCNDSDEFEQFYFDRVIYD